MKRIVLTISALLMAGPAWSQGMSDYLSNPGVGGNGKAISGFLYGNTSNPRDGTGPGVDPSLSPGPWACVYDDGSCTGETYAGSSMGDITGFLLFGGSPKSDFANGQANGPSFGK